MKPIFIFLIIAIILSTVWFLFLRDRSQEGPQTTSGPESFNESQFRDGDDKILALMETAKGDIEIELYPKVAPKTVLNFIALSQKGFYDGTKFHRVVPGFVIQGGDPLSRTDNQKVGTGGPGYNFEDEINPKSLNVPDAVIKQLEAAGYKYDYTLKSLPSSVGAVSMANAGPNTNGSQFFVIIEEDQPSLNGKHTVFGKVVKGMDVVRAIKQGDIIKRIRGHLKTPF